MDHEAKEEITSIVDKIIGVQTLSDKSCAYTYLILFKIRFSSMIKN